MSSRAKKSSLEKYFGHYGKIREIDWNPGDQYAYILYDDVNDAEDARNHLNEKSLPNGCSDELRIDYGDPKRFESNLESPPGSRSVTRSVSRSRTRSHTQSKTKSRSRTRSKSEHHLHSRSASPNPPQPPQKRNSHAYENNGHYSSSSNDEKGYKKQKISSTLSRKIKTPPIDNDEANYRHENDSRRSKSPQNNRQHRRRHHYQYNETQEEQDSDFGTKLENENKNNSLEMEHDSQLLIKDALINKDTQLANITNISEIVTSMRHTWYGVFTLKKIAFPTKFFLLAGNRNLAEQLLPVNPSSIMSNITNQPLLRITQRLRLDPIKVEELEKKLYDSNYSPIQHVNGINSETCQFSVLIALPNSELELKSQKGDDCNDSIGGDDGAVSTSSMQHRSLHNLIIYLNSKTAAGVIPLPDDDRPTAIVHAFPPNCQFSIKLLNQLLPNVKTDSTATQQNNSNSSNYTINNDSLLIVLLKN